MKKLLVILGVVFLVGCSNASISIKKVESNNVPSQTIAPSLNKKYKNIIMFIGDGMGPNHVDAGGIYLCEPLCFDVTNEKWAYHAYSNTDSLTSEGFTL